MSGRTHLAALAAILLLGLGLRIGYALNPVEPQSPDSRGYARIAQSLYLDERFEERGSFAAAELQQPSNYSPGVPLLVAGIYELSGAEHPELARLVLALVGAVSVLLAYLIGRRLAGPAAGLVAAVVVAGYPALLEYQGMLMTEPLGATLLAGAFLASLWASDRGGTLAWALPGLLLGLMAMVRPEYLLFGLLLPVLALWRTRPSRGWWPGLAAAAAAALAFLLPVLPWTVRNVVVLDRLVPISTGSGKVLYVGTYLPAGGDGTELKQQLLERDAGLRRSLALSRPLRRPSPTAPRLLFSQLQAPREGTGPRALFSQRYSTGEVIHLETVLAAVAERRYPDQPTDVALGRMGRENIGDYLAEDPLGFGGMLARKAYEGWITGPRATMLEAPWNVLHVLVVLAALLGLALLVLARRWEAVPIGVLLVAVTAMSALLIASPRRVVVILPIVAALAGIGVAHLFSRRCASWIRSPRASAPS